MQRIMFWINIGERYFGHALDGPVEQVNHQQRARKKLSEPFVEVEHDDADVDNTHAGVRELGHDPCESAFAFGITKFAFDRDTVAFVLEPLKLFGFQCFQVFRGLLSGAT